MVRTRKRKKYTHFGVSPHIRELVYAADLVKKTGRWVILVCPTKEVYDQLLPKFSAVVSDSLVCSGRTAIWKQGGRLSLTTVTDRPDFVPDDDMFSVQFIGWGTVGYTSGEDGMVRWTKAASATIRVST